MARGLGLRIGQAQLLQDITFGIEPADRVLVTGHSGSGKTTLARCLTGIIPRVVAGQRYGSVSVFGTDPARVPLHETAQRLGLVFQRPSAQLFNFTVYDEVIFGPLNSGIPRAQADQRAREALAAVGLNGFEGRDIRALSYGQLQRLCIASILALRPAAIMLDEPTAHLDRAGRHLLAAALRRLHGEQGTALIMIEHRSDAVWDGFFQRRLHMEAGRLAAPPRGQPRDFGSMLGAPSRRGGGAVPVLTLEAVSAFPHRPPGPSSREEPVLRQVNLDLFWGDLVLLTGDNGSGKSTLALVMAGLIRPAAGRRVCRIRPFLLFQEPAGQLLTDTVEQEIAFSLRFAGAGRRARQDGLTDRLSSFLEWLDLHRLRSAPIASLSVGEQRRVALGSVIAACMADPGQSLLILDEPTAGQDDEHLDGMVRALGALNQELGCTVVVITHDERLTRGWKSRHLRMDGGRLFEENANAEGVESERAQCGRW